MPAGDGTGPLGYGPMTGRGTGYCAGYGMPGYMNRPFGCAGAFGGRGRGWRNMYYSTGLPRWARGHVLYPAYPGTGYSGGLTPEREMEALKNQSDFFQKQIEVLNQRIRELEEIAAKKSDS